MHEMFPGLVVRPHLIRIGVAKTPNQGSRNPGSPYLARSSAAASGLHFSLDANIEGKQESPPGLFEEAGGSQELKLSPLLPCSGIVA